MLASIVQAQTTTGTTTTPGVPEAGAGGDSIGLFLLLGAVALIATAGVLFFRWGGEEERV